MIKEVKSLELNTDYDISNPQYDIPWDPPKGTAFDDRFSELSLPLKDNANYVFIIGYPAV